METPPIYETLGLAGEPGWPEGPGPFLFLIEESGPLERLVLSGWRTILY